MRAVPPIPERLARKGRSWQLEVVDVGQPTPAMRRVTARLAGAEPLDPVPGQSLILLLPQDGAEAVARHYTIRRYDPATRHLAIDVVLHGDTPANRWARAARLGDLFAAVGPRGHVRLNPMATEHLMVADETGLPAVLSMLEGLPSGHRALALVEIAGDAERQPVPEREDIDLRWLVRPDGAAPGRATMQALRHLSCAPGPDHHAYLAGETDAVRTQRRHLLMLGFTKEAISAEGYWRPGRIGGHDHVDA